MDAAAYAEVVKQVALLAICTLSFSIRLFSVVKYESVIHGVVFLLRSAMIWGCRAV
jgi:hypothetical protein